MNDTVIVAIISGVVSMIINFGSKWLDNRNGITKEIKEISKGIKDLQDGNSMNSDMIYQILDHLASNNNSGEMKRALDDYNAHFRHTHS